MLQLLGRTPRLLCDYGFLNLAHRDGIDLAVGCNGCLVSRYAKVFQPLILRLVVGISLGRARVLPSNVPNDFLEDRQLDA